MLQKKFNIFGRLIPAWIMAGLLVVAASGAATGTVLAGQISGDLGVTISQSLLIHTDGVDTRNADGTDAGAYDAVSDNKTEFASGIELKQGDCYFIRLSLSNVSDYDLFGRFDITVPDGVTASAVKGSITALDNDCEASGTPTANDTTELVRTDGDTWSFNLDDVADANTNVDISLILAMADNVVPGFYSMGAEFVQTDR